MSTRDQSNIEKYRDAVVYKYPDAMISNTTAQFFVNEKKLTIEGLIRNLIIFFLVGFLTIIFLAFLLESITSYYEYPFWSNFVWLSILCVPLLFIGAIVNTAAFDKVPRYFSEKDLDELLNEYNHSSKKSSIYESEEIDTEKLLELKKLLDREVITKEEFEKAKSKLLSDL